MLNRLRFFKTTSAGNSAAKLEIFYVAIDKILWNDWDPIGVRPIAPGASDEYEDYVPELVMLKLNKAGVKKIEERLFRLEAGLARTPDLNRCRRVAEKIVSTPPQPLPKGVGL